jgi:hypothetical protein
MSESEVKALEIKIISLYEEVEKTKLRRFDAEVFVANKLRLQEQDNLIEKLGYDPRTNNVAQGVKQKYRNG